MRFSNRQWQVAPSIPAATLAEFPELHPLLVQLLLGRGVTTQAAIDEFLGPDWGRDIHDPFRFRAMTEVVERLIRAIRKREKIVIYGDYDADGVTASAILAVTLRNFGANWEVYIPDRQTEGYGLNLTAVEEIARAGAKLILTVDCGSSNVAEVARARALGVDVIVTDHHHEPPKRPTPLAFLNPCFPDETYPFHSLSAGGVAFKLVQALLRQTRSDRGAGATFPEGWEKWLLDFVVISTIADMVPLVGENRTLVRYGLTVLRKSRRVGIQALLRSARLLSTAVNEDDVAYILAPRINAAGRLNHASTAFELLTTDDADAARRLSEELAQNNAERQRLTQSIYQACLEQIGATPDESIVFAGNPDWPAGILGLVAGKLVQRFSRPAVVFGAIKGETVGSGRSVPALNIIEALDEVKPHLTRYGGHSQACGFTLATPKNQASFEHDLRGTVAKRLAGKSLIPVLEIDSRLPIESVDWALIELLSQLEPYGVGNRKPRFLAENVEITAIERVGGDQQHLRLQVVDGDHVVRKMIGFSFGEHGEQLTVGETVDVVYEVGVRTWNGNREIELKMVDAKHSHEPL